jgi:hypothetical protein
LCDDDTRCVDTYAHPIISFLQIMMMEAMRLSLLEHEEEQRRQAQAQSRQTTDANEAVTDTSRGSVGEERSIPASVVTATTAKAQSANIPPSSSSSSSSTTFQQQQQLPHLRSSSLANEGAPSIAPSIRQPHTPQELGISSSMMAELSELVDGGLPNFQTEGTSPTTATFSTTASTPNTPPPLTSVNRMSNPASPIGSPSRIGTNPNNPFRRAGGSSTTSPSHSRQGSTLYTSWTGANDSPGPEARH